MSRTIRKIADKALEIRMQDTLEGMADFTTRFAWDSTPDTLTILSIEAAAPQPVSALRAPVVPVGCRRSRDVVSFLIEREAREERQSGVALSA